LTGKRPANEDWSFLLYPPGAAFACRSPLAEPVEAGTLYAIVPFDKLRARSLLQAELVEADLQDNIKLDKFLSILYTGSK
jgi:hypothetical protein